MQLVVPAHTPAVTGEADILHSTGMHSCGQRKSTLNPGLELERVLKSSVSDITTCWFLPVGLSLGKKIDHASSRNPASDCVKTPTVLRNTRKF